MNYPPPKELSYWKKFDPTKTRTDEDRITPGQLVAIRSIANSQRIDFEDACVLLFQCKPEELNKSAARTYINWLTKQIRRHRVSEPLNLCPTCQSLQVSDGKQIWCSEKHVFQIASTEAA